MYSDETYAKVGGIVSGMVILIIICLFICRSKMQVKITTFSPVEISAITDTLNLYSSQFQSTTTQVLQTPTKSKTKIIGLTAYGQPIDENYSLVIDGTVADNYLTTSPYDMLNRMTRKCYLNISPDDLTRVLGNIMFFYSTSNSTTSVFDPSLNYPTDSPTDTFTNPTQSPTDSTNPVSDINMYIENLATLEDLNYKEVLYDIRYCIISFTRIYLNSNVQNVRVEYTGTNQNIYTGKLIYPTEETINFRYTIRGGRIDMFFFEE